MKNFCNLVGPKISRFRNERGMSQPQLAALLQRKGWDISREVLARIETRRRRITDFEMVFIARALKVSIAELLPKSDLNKQVDHLIEHLEKSAESHEKQRG